MGTISCVKKAAISAKIKNTDTSAVKAILLGTLSLIGMSAENTFAIDRPFPAACREIISELMGEERRNLSEIGIVLDSSESANGFRVTDEHKLKKFICSNFSKIYKNPKFRSLKTFAEKNLRANKGPEIRALIAKNCKHADVATYLAGPFWAATSLARQAGYGRDNYFIQHGSNFYLSYLGLSLAYCIGEDLPRSKRLALLGAAYGVDAAYTIVEEVDLGDHRRGRGVGMQTNTDWDDIGASAMSAFTVATWVTLFERSHGMSFAAICGKK